jgi:hypothetical protein
LGRKEIRNDLFFIKGNMTTVEEKYEVNIRMLDVMTGEVRLSFAEEGNSKEVYIELSQRIRLYRTIYFGKRTMHRAKKVSISTVKLLEEVFLSVFRQFPKDKS